MNLSKFRRGTTHPSPLGRPPVPRRIPRGPICEISNCDQVQSLSCRTPDGRILGLCSDCGLFLGYEVLEVVHSGRRVL